MSDGYWIGVDLGGTKILAGLFDDELTLLARAKQPTGGEAPGRSDLPSPAEQASEAARREGPGPEAKGPRAPATPDGDPTPEPGE